MLPEALRPLNALEDNPHVRQRFAVPKDLRILATIVVLLGALATGFGWFIQVDQVIQAEGVLETQQRLFEIRSPRSGQLKQVFVDHGQTVSAGTVLAEIEPMAVHHQLDIARTEQRELERNLWRHFYALESSLDQAQAKQLLTQLDSIADPIATSNIRQQLRQELHHQQQTVQSEQQALEAQQQALAHQLLATEALVTQAQIEVTRLQPLVESHLASPAQWAQLQQAYLQHQRDWIQLQTQHSVQQAQWHALDAQLQQLTLSFQVSHWEQFEQALSALEQNRFVQRQQQLELEQHHIRAPVAGTLDEVQWQGAGEVVQTGQTLAVMRPEFAIEQMWVAIRVPAVDVVWLQPGQAFRATVQGRSGDDHGALHGQLGFISSVTTETDSAPMQSAARGEIERIEPSHRRPQPTHWMRPGLPLEVTIQAGQRRLVYYLLDPFRQTLQRAWREPS